MSVPRASRKGEHGKRLGAPQTIACSRFRLSSPPTGNFHPDFTPADYGRGMTEHATTDTNGSATDTLTEDGSNNQRTASAKDRAPLTVPKAMTLLSEARKAKASALTAIARAKGKADQADRDADAAVEALKLAGIPAETLKELGLTTVS